MCGSMVGCQDPKCVKVRTGVRIIEVWKWAGAMITKVSSGVRITEVWKRERKKGSQMCGSMVGCQDSKCVKVRTSVRITEVKACQNGPM